MSSKKKYMISSDALYSHFPVPAPSNAANLGITIIKLKNKELPPIALHCVVPCLVNTFP